MSSDRELPATPRRRALARQAGHVAQSPALTAGAAWLGALLGAAWSLSAGLARVQHDLGVAAEGSAAARSFSVGEVPYAVLALALPILLGAALAALAVHVAQTRGVWLPRRDLDGAPVEELSANRRAVDAVLALARGGLVLGAMVVWLVRAAPVLVRVPSVPSDGVLPLVLRILLSGMAVIAAAIIVGGAVDLLITVLRHRADAQMTATERRRELAEAGAAPDRRRGQRQAREFAGAHAAATVAGAMRRATFLLTDGHVAIAIEASSDAPRIVASGRGTDATQLLALARRYRVAVQRDARLVAALAAAPLGRAEARHWPALAEGIAAASPTRNATPD